MFKNDKRACVAHCLKHLTSQNSNKMHRRILSQIFSLAITKCMYYLRDFEKRKIIIHSLCRCKLDCYDQVPMFFCIPNSAKIENTSVMLTYVVTRYCVYIFLDLTLYLRQVYLYFRYEFIGFFYVKLFFRRSFISRKGHCLRSGCSFPTEYELCT